jgi:hypothetical protein
MTSTIMSHCSQGGGSPAPYNDIDIDSNGMANNEQRRGGDHDDGHHHSTPNRHHEQLLAG